MGVEIKRLVVFDAELEDTERFVSGYLSTSVENEDNGGRMRWYLWHSVEYRFNHILNVVDLATRITDHGGADVNIVRIIALFHDIPKLEADQKVHVEEGVCVAREFLSSRGDYPNPFVDQACQVVSDYSYQGPLTDVSPEMRCLIETDILDRTGTNDTTLMLPRIGYEVRTHMDAAGMIERIFEHGHDASDRFETDTAQSSARRRLERVKWSREWSEEEVSEVDHDGQFSG